MSVPARVVHKRRATITDLPLYYSGHLLKKLLKEKNFKKYYGELRGATLFLYKDDTQDTYIEKLDLENLKSMELDSPYQRKAPTIFTLNLHTEEVQLKMDNSDTGEEWKGYILTMVKKKIPSKLQLLPGQMVQLQEVLNQERKRKTPIVRPPLPPRPAFLPSPSASPIPPLPEDKPGHSTPDIPACFYSVSRQEAEQMLEANPEYGGIILRPSTLANNYALTLRQLTPSGPVMKNFRVASTNSGFVIELDTAVNVSSLDDVLKYFIEKTEYRLHPYMPSQPYDTCIGVSPAPKCVSITSPTPKTLPKAQVAPTLRSQNKEELPLPPTKEEGEYVIHDDQCPDHSLRLDVSPAPKCVSITSPTPKTLPKAQVAPTLRSQNKEELPLPPTKEEGEYVIPDDQCPDHNLRLVQLDGELRDVLKFRREKLYTASDKEEVTTYVNQTNGKSPSGTVQWATRSAAE